MTVWMYLHMYIAHNRLPHTISALKLKLIALEASSSMYVRIK